MAFMYAPSVFFGTLAMSGSYFFKGNSLARSVFDGAITTGILEVSYKMISFTPGNLMDLIPNISLKTLVPAAAISGACANAYLIKQVTKHNDLENLKKLCNGETPRDSKSNFIYTVGAYLPIATLSFLTGWSYAPLALGMAFFGLAKRNFNPEVKGGLINKFNSDSLGYLALGTITLLANSFTPLTTLANSFSTEGMLIVTGLSAATALFLNSKISNLKESCAGFVTSLEANQQNTKNDMNNPENIANLDAAFGPKKSKIYRHLIAAINPEIKLISNKLTNKIASYFLLVKICNKADIDPNDFINDGLNIQDQQIVNNIRDLMSVTPTMTNKVQIQNFCTNIGALTDSAIDSDYMEKLLKYISKRVNEESKQISL